MLRGVWIGAADRDEFRPVRAWLEQQSEQLQLTVLPTIASFAAVAHSAEVVIIGESWPDEFTMDDVTRLITVAPLARVVWLTGAWSEAVGRTRSHWPAAWRVPLCDAISRIERELAALQACRNGDNTTASTFPPWTASRQEAWLWQQSADSQTSPAGKARTVCLDEIADPALAAWLSEQLQSAGHHIATGTADGVLYDVDPWSPLVAENLRHALVRHATAQPIALTAWAIPALRADLAALGITLIADKLAPDSLLRALSVSSAHNFPRVLYESHATS